MFPTLAAGAGTNVMQEVADSVGTQFSEAAPIAAGVIIGGAALAFGIKGAWVAWRTGSKALGKAGS